MDSNQTAATRQQALRIAQRLGCYGAHQHDDGSWMPCVSHEEMESVLKNKKSAPVSIRESELTHRSMLVQSKTKTLFASRREALIAGRENGC